MHPNDSNKFLISPNSRHSRDNSRHSSRQSGVTIVIALVLLATIGFISFSLSTVVLRSIRFSRVLQNSEIALAGANSGSEVSLFRFQRNIGNIGVINSPLQSGASYDVLPNLSIEIYTQAVSQGQPAYINLYDPENINSTAPGFQTVRITNAGPNNVDIDVIPWSNAGTITCSFSNVGSTSRTCPTSGVLPPDRYQIFVRMHSSGNQSATVRVTATGAGGQAKGIPSRTPSIDVVGKISDVKRKIRVDL